VLRGLVDTTLANRKLFVLHERNQTALSALHIKGHDGDHEEMEQQFRRILANGAIPARDRVTAWTNRWTASGRGSRRGQRSSTTNAGFPSSANAEHRLPASCGSCE
jgi:hypothetical protein